MTPRVPQVNFSKGEIAPYLYGRFDVQTYSAGLKKGRNCYVMKYGGLCKRPGTWMVGEVLNPSQPSRLIPFQFSIEQAYALEFGNEYVAPCLQGGRLLEAAQAITAITNAVAAQVTIAAHGYAVGDFLFPSGISGEMGAYLNSRMVTVVTVIDPNNFTIAIDTTEAGAFSAGGDMARIYKFATPYAGSDLSEVSFTQTTDTMYLAHLSYPPSQIVRSGSLTWATNPVNFGTSMVAPAGIAVAVASPNQPENGFYALDAYYVVTSYNDNTSQESIASSSVVAYNDLSLQGNINTVTWDASENATRYKVYKSTVDGFYGYIGTTVGLTIVDDEIGPDYSQSPPVIITPFPTSSDYPSTVTLFQQRAIWARTTNTPSGIFGTRSGDLDNFNRSVPELASDSINFAIVSGQAVSINGLCSTSYLLGMCSDGIYIIDGDGNGGILSGASSPAARRQIGRGSSRLPAIVIDSVVFYVPVVGNSVRTIGFDYTVDGLKTNDVSIFSPQFFEGYTIVSWCYQREPRSLIWVVRSDGALLCFAWEEEQNVFGWTLCETEGTVLSVCSITENGEDSLYLTVQRTIGGVTKTFVEQLVSHLWTDVTQTCFVDCAVTATFETPQSVITGLWHLEGATNVAGIVDGVPVSGLTVANGQVTLPASIGAGTVVTLGLPYDLEIDTLPIRMEPQGIGSNLGRIQSSDMGIVQILNSGEFDVGIDGDHLFTARMLDEQGWDHPGQPQSGICQVTLDNKITTEIGLSIRQSSAAPFTLLAVALDPMVSG